MGKLFSNKVSFQIMVVMLVLFLANSLMESRKLKSYVYERVYRDLAEAALELEYMDNDIKRICEQDKTYSIDLEHIYSLVFMEDEIAEIFNVDKGEFEWEDLLRFQLEITIIGEKESLSKEDIEYLKNVQTCNERLIELYGRLLRENGIEKSSLYKDYSKIEAMYKQFMIEAGNTVLEEEYKEIEEYIKEKHDERGRKNEVW